MALKTTEWRPGPTVCRCCLTEGCYKDISTEYFWMGKREVYAEMLTETFDLSIAYSQSGGPNSHSRLICEPCISRLRDAADFKRQVQECERSFMQYLDPGSSLIDVEACTELEKEVKVERVKEERDVSDDDDFDDRPDFGDDDDYDDLDDEPLTKLASKVPKKESVDALDLIDNAKATEKRKSTSKTKGTSAKKAKTKKVIATSSKEKPEPRKKKGGRKITETSIWQMTVSERYNAAKFLSYTTVRPFKFMGSSFKCFFCTEYFSEINPLLEHTSTHEVKDEAMILEKYVPKGKRTLQVDISKLKCRLCDQPYLNLSKIREHLTTEHQMNFAPVGNGVTEYIMEARNGLFNCHICEMKFPLFSSYNAHMNSHVGKVVCDFCGTGFLNQHILMTHKETHVTKNFSCKECDRVFVKKAQLKYHENIFHKGKDRVRLKKCQLCAETFKEHYSKMMHLKQVHGMIKTFQCHLCASVFSTRRALTEHTTKSHTEKYKCKMCSKCFGIESKLKLHMRGHTGEKKFVCPICKNNYMHKITLQKHMKGHDKVFKFTCPDCPTGFNDKDECTKHITECHSLN